MTAPSRRAASSAPFLDQTFRTERRRLLSYLARRAGRDAAPDLLQETFLRAVCSPNVGHIDNPKRYVWRIARNLLIDRARQQRRFPGFVPLDEQRDPVVGPEQQLQVEANDVLRHCAQALDHLSERSRKVFLLSRAEHLTYREISTRLGIGDKAVEYHMRRALAVLRRRFANAGYAEQLNRSKEKGSFDRGPD